MIPSIPDYRRNEPCALDDLPDNEIGAAIEMLRWLKDNRVPLVLLCPTRQEVGRTLAATGLVYFEHEHEDYIVPAYRVWRVGDCR